MTKAETKTRSGTRLDFWFDYTCPYAYLGSTQVERLGSRMGAVLTWKPMLLGGVFRANDTPQRLFEQLAPAKAAHNALDMQRWAALYGVPLQMPAGHPLRSVEALRATLVTAPLRTRSSKLRSVPFRRVRSARPRGWSTAPSCSGARTAFPSSNAHCGREEGIPLMAP